MSKVRISFSISADGYGAGPDQSRDNPLGVGGMQLHSWALPTRTFQQALFGKTSGTTGVDGVAVVRQYLQAGLVDHAHVAITPALLGSGEHVFAGMNLPALGYDIVEHAASESALHVVLAKGNLSAT